MAAVFNPSARQQAHLHSIRLPSAFWVLLLVWLGCSPSFAHERSTSYINLVVTQAQLSGRWEIPIRDLDLSLGLDVDTDHKVSSNEWSIALEEIHSFALQQIKLTLDGVTGVLHITNSVPIVHESEDGTGLALDFAVTNALVFTNLDVSYRFMFDKKPFEQGFCQLDCNGAIQTAIFTAEKPSHRFDLTQRQSQHEFLSFLWHGMHHIWIGYDHILFLIALLLPAVLRFEDGQWRAVMKLSQAFMNVFKIVTAFTIAHSLTLSLAALQIVSLPSRWVEATIAASVLVAALNNIRVFFRGPVWVVAFIFGLVHGFGFANVLADLHLQSRDLVMALLGFNLGVEVGQLAIVGVFLPIAYAVRSYRFYRHWVLKVGSALIALVAFLWLLERVFEWRIISP